MLKRKHQQRHENKVNDNLVLYRKALRCETIKNNKKVFIKCVNIVSYIVFPCIIDLAQR